MTSLRDQRDRGARGFTLLEVMIVLAIMSLAAAIAIPLLARSGGRAALGSAAQEVRVALAAAHSAAIAQDREVIFAGGRGFYRVDGAPHALAASPGLSVEIEGGARIAFFPSGGATGGRVVVRSRNAQREIEVEALTGRAVLVR
jgi:general secretion pathway protein H